MLFVSDHITQNTSPERTSVVCRQLSGMIRYFSMLWRLTRMHQTMILDVDEALLNSAGTGGEIFTRLLPFPGAQQRCGREGQGTLARGDRDEIAIFFLPSRWECQSFREKGGRKVLRSGNATQGRRDMDAVKAEVPSFLEAFGGVKTAVRSYVRSEHRRLA